MTMQGTAVAKVSADDIFDAKQAAIESYKAVIFLECADSNQYITLWQTLRNEALIGQDNYPRTMTKTYNILTKYQAPNQQ
jgi:hypothetical protein